MDALRSFLARVAVSLDTERAGVELVAWRDRQLDLALVKELHRAVIGKQASVRCTLGDGTFVLAASEPGRLRTRAQAFRLDEHVEVAWEPRTLSFRLTELLRDLVPQVDRDPVAAASHLVWALSRAQPFAGMNERVALVLGSWVLRAVGLPPLHVEQIERDPAFGAALVAATVNDRATLTRYLADAIWDEALVLVERLVPAAPAPPQRWTLADEHAAAAQARATTARVPDADVESFVNDAGELIERAFPRFGVALSPPRRESVDTYLDRLRVARHAMVRGRPLSPQEPMVHVRWPVRDALGLEAKLVVGAAGRGMSGALAAHVALEVADSPIQGVSPGFMLAMDETVNARHARTPAWVERAIAYAVEHSPLRV